MFPLLASRCLVSSHFTVTVPEHFSGGNPGTPAKYESYKTKLASYQWQAISDIKQRLSFAVYL